MRGLVVNYACHCTTLGGEFNKICADWAGYACEAIERAHPGAIAMVTIGCGADANPNPRGTIALTPGTRRVDRSRGRSTAPGAPDPASGPDQTALKRIELPIGPLPTRADWEERPGSPAPRECTPGSTSSGSIEASRLPTTVPYVVQTWAFGDDLAMVFLAGEVVVDYARRLKSEGDGRRLWVSAYCNDVPCYIASRRLIGEGGYEVDSSMVYYGRPTRLAPEAEDRIIDTVRTLLPPSFLKSGPR